MFFDSFLPLFGGEKHVTLVSLVHAHSHTNVQYANTLLFIHAHTHVCSLPPFQEHQRQSDSPSWCHLQIKHCRVSADQRP